MRGSQPTDLNQVFGLGSNPAYRRLEPRASVAFANTAPAGVIDFMQKRFGSEYGAFREPDRKTAKAEVMSDISRDEIDAKIAAAEARTDTKFAQMMGELQAMRADLGGKLDTIGVRVDAVEKSTHGTKATIIVTGIAVVGLVVAIMAFGSQSIGLGFSVSDVATAAAQRALTEQSLRSAPSSSSTQPSPQGATPVAPATDAGQPQK